MSSRLRARRSRSLRHLARAFVLVPFFVSIFLTPLAGCGQGSNSGPGTIHWDRETCEHCQMVISEKEHAVQIRLQGDRRIHAFDDLGCGLLWLDQHQLRIADPKGPEIWIMDSKAGDWMDARGSEFEAGVTTPMAYGFGITEHGLSLAEVQVAVLEAEQRRRSSAADSMDRAPGPEDARRARQMDAPRNPHHDAKGQDVD